MGDVVSMRSSGSTTAAFQPRPNARPQGSRQRAQQPLIDPAPLEKAWEQSYQEQTRGMTENRAAFQGFMKKSVRRLRNNPAGTRLGLIEVILIIDAEWQQIQRFDSLVDASSFWEMRTAILQGVVDAFNEQAPDKYKYTLNRSHAPEDPVIDLLP